MFQHAQLTFASYHFLMTAILLHVLSLPAIGLFTPKRARLLDMLPLAGAMCLNVVLQNLSLANSSIPFYQICRVLLTPVVALFNFILYQKPLPPAAVLTLVPICVGVSMATYFDALSHAGVSNDNYDSSEGGYKTRQTSVLGVIFAFSGVISSAVYTIWVSVYHAKYSMSSLQLLSHQAPLGSAMLLYVIPWTDSFPVLSSVPLLDGWMLVLLVRCACI